MKKAGSRCSLSRRCPFPAWAAAETSAALYLPILNRGGGAGRAKQCQQTEPVNPAPHPRSFFGVALPLSVAQLAGQSSAAEK